MLEPVQMETQIAWTCMVEDIAFMFSTIYLRLEGKVPPPPRIELGSEMSQVSEVNDCILQSIHPLPAHDVMPDKEIVNFNFRWIFEICRWKKSEKNIF